MLGISSFAPLVSGGLRRDGSWTGLAISIESFVFSTECDAAFLIVYIDAHCLPKVDPVALKLTAKIKDLESAGVSRGLEC